MIMKQWTTFWRCDDTAAHFKVVLFGTLFLIEFEFWRANTLVSQSTRKRSRATRQPEPSGLCTCREAKGLLQNTVRYIII